MNDGRDADEPTIKVRLNPDHIWNATVPNSPPVKPPGRFLTRGGVGYTQHVSTRSIGPPIPLQPGFVSDAGGRRGRLCRSPLSLDCPAIAKYALTFGFSGSGRSVSARARTPSTYAYGRWDSRRAFDTHQTTGPCSSCRSPQPRRMVPGGSRAVLFIACPWRWLGQARWEQRCHIPTRHINLLLGEILNFRQVRFTKVRVESESVPKICVTQSRFREHCT